MKTVMRLFTGVISAFSVVSATAFLPQAHAGEVYGGVYQHDSDFWRNTFTIIGTDPKNYEAGMDYEIGWRSDPVESWAFLHRPSVYAFAQFNDSENTNHAAVGLTWKRPLFKSEKIYGRISAGLAVHDGRLKDYGAAVAPTGDRSPENRTPFSKRWLFNAGLSLGYDLTPRTSVELSWDHISNAGLDGQLNLGQDNLGLRYNYRY